MATVNRFEDLEVWKLSRSIVNEVYKFTGEYSFSKDFELRNQIRRSAISLMSNIAEGFESGSDRKFANYLKIAKGSSGECRSQLYIAFDQGYLKKTDFVDLKNNLLIVSRMLSKLESYLLNRDASSVRDIEIKYDIDDSYLG